jgi:peptidoglycan hydrolase-like protein with peptidoglycan-binding domain
MFKKYIEVMNKEVLNMGKGTLKVQVHTADDALPVEGVNILIKDKSGRVLYTLVTDRMGNTKKVSLYAPDKNRTLSPDAPGPYYGAYDVEMRKSNYVTLIEKDVQIFDTIDAYLPINYEPSPTGKEVVNTVAIPPGLLHSAAQRHQEKPEHATLPEVKVPDYIVVKLGTPTSSARTVRVKFTDYIKNVTSSEIYPTWPVNSLKANIHAIVTFTLNRIFTEWYKSRGQSFDITNSTQFDMAFVENRDIFANIAALVDEYFNAYARRIGFRDPFFTEFCNGTTSTCPGMSQWGTVTLANQGLTPLQILRSFYPRDLDVVRTNNIGTVRETYPGSPLSQGSQGANVQKMQNYLNRIRVNFPLIPSINPDGVFGSQTVNAVRVFQNTFSLSQTGTIDRGTWYKIIQIFVAVTKLAELTSEGLRIGIGENPPTSTIREGSRGPDVIQLQFLLNYISQYYSDIQPVIQDSVFGRTTRDSVVAFQRKFDLIQDGVVGSATWRLLYQVYKNIQSGIGIVPAPPVSPPSPPSSSPAYPGAPLRVGSRGDNVLLIQQRLNKISGKYPSIPRLKEDGIFGSGTQSAVIAFQRIFGLAADGVIGPLTWNRIVEVSNSIGGPPPTPAPYPGTPLRAGSRGNNVLLIQQRLNALSSRYPSIPKLAVDGVFGQQTQNSVTVFQRLFGLTADGVVGPLTWDRMMSL